MKVIECILLSMTMYVTCIRAFSSIRHHRSFKISQTSIHIAPIIPDGERRSVTGRIYDAEGDRSKYPIVKLFTKEGCTLCDKVTDVLKHIRNDYPHSLEAVDITDEDKTDIYDMYKWDIPVLRINDMYWTKHRLEENEAINAIVTATKGEFVEQKGEPNAAAMEKRMSERKAELDENRS